MSTDVSVRSTGMPIRRRRRYALPISVFLFCFAVCAAEQLLWVCSCKRRKKFVFIYFVCLYRAKEEHVPIFQRNYSFTCDRVCLRVFPYVKCFYPMLKTMRTLCLTFATTCGIVCCEMFQVTVRNISKIETQRKRVLLLKQTHSRTSTTYIHDTTTQIPTSCGCCFLYLRAGFPSFSNRARTYRPFSSTIFLCIVLPF